MDLLFQVRSGQTVFQLEVYHLGSYTKKHKLLVRRKTSNDHLEMKLGLCPHCTALKAMNKVQLRFSITIAVLVMTIVELLSWRINTTFETWPRRILLHCNTNLNHHRGNMTFSPEKTKWSCTCMPLILMLLDRYKSQSGSSF